MTTNYNLFEEKGEPKRNRAEALQLTSRLTPYRWAKPAYTFCDASPDLCHKRGTRNHAHLKRIPRRATRAIIGMELQNNYDTHSSFSVDVWSHLLKIDI